MKNQGRCWENSWDTL